MAASTPSSSTPKSLSTRILDAVQPFIIGGLSGMIATCFIQPVDLVKVVIQLQSEKLALAKTGGSVSVGKVMSQLYSNGGIRGFYRGIDSALARQLFYTTTRLGVYKKITESIGEDNKSKGIKHLSFFQKVYCAAFAGFLGSLVSNPADLALIRMQADTQLPPSERRNYKNVVNAFTTITKEEGFSALWRGSTPTVIRAVVLNLAMLSSYDQGKEMLVKLLDSPQTLSIRLGASAVAGFLASFCSLPFDNAKTKIQKMRVNPDGSYPYKNIFDAMGKTVTNEGFSKLWVGFPTFAARIAPHVCITLVLQDKLTDLITKIRANKE